MKKFLIYMVAWVAALLPLSAQDTGGVLDPDRPVWQESDPDGAWYLANRRALVGRGCSVNKLVNVVGVGSWVDQLENLTDEDLNNYASFPKVVGVGVTTNPVTSVRDINNYYRDMPAGFCVVASSGSSVLSLDVIKAMSIWFYRDGEVVDTQPVEEGLSASGLGLSLISIPGSDDANIYLTARTTETFDEVCLVDAGGVNLTVGSSIYIKYAFVGSINETLLTTNGVVAMGEGYYLSSAEGWNPVLLGIPFPLDQNNIDHLIDDDLTGNSAVLTPIVAAGYQGGVKLCVANRNNEEEVFKAGSEVGFCWQNGAVLNLEVGAWIRILLFDRQGNVVQEETVSGDVVGLGVASGGNGTSSIISDVDFSGAEIRFHTVLAVSVGAMGVYYGFVHEAPETTHHCDINPTFDTNLCEEQTSIQLESNPGLSVSWSVESAPAGSQVTVTDGGYVTDMDLDGDYVFRATSLCGKGCYELVTINKGENIGSEVDNICGEPLVNMDASVDSRYALTDDLHGSSGSLISITDLQGEENILDGDYDRYATYVPGASIADNLMIVGVRTTDGSLIYDAATEQYPAKLGFMMELESEGLDVSALQFFLIRGYHNGVEVFEKVITETDIVSVGLAGSNRQQKMRFCVEVSPTDVDSEGNPVQVDEIMLWKAGVLNITLSRLNIYYPFKEVLNPADGECGGPFGCGISMISAEGGNSGATISAGDQGSAVQVAGVNDNLSYFIDNDLETAMMVANTVTVGGGTVFSIKPGYTLDFRHQLCIVVDNNTYLAGIDAGKWLTVRTYYQDTPTGDEFTNWNVLGVNVIGYGDKSILILQPKARYDEVQIEVAGVAGVLSFQKFYGMFLRSDIDGDGTPDCEDPSSCFTHIGDLTVSQICQGDEMVISGKGLAGTDYFISLPEQGIYEAVPVDLEGYFSVVYKLDVVGRYNIIFYDGSHNIVDTAPYTVHPTYTEWKTNPVNTDWNEWSNWTAGSPYCCTDVVINGGASKYPLLPASVDAADEYCCNRIHFKPRAAVDCPTSLNYHKAWVEMELAPNRYYLLSAPLKSLYTGDMFIPATGMPDYFTDLTSDNMPQNRFNPRIYQRLWAATAPAKLFNGTDVSVGIDPGANLGDAVVNQAEWSKNFNSLKYAYPLGSGFSLWVDNGTFPDTQRFTFRFPKEHTSYNYYSDYDGTMTSLVETLDRTSSGRFAYEQENEESKPLTFEYRGETRSVYVNVLPLTVTVTAQTGTATNLFLVGNPFMSRIDIAAFMAGNEGVRAVKVYDGNTTLTVNSDLQTNASELTVIEPMQSFFVEFDTESVARDITFTERMLTGGSPSFNSEAGALRLVADNGCGEAAVLFTERGSGHAVEALVDGEVKPSLAVYAVLGGAVYDIVPAETAEIPLAICSELNDSLTLRFESRNGFDASAYLLRDNSTGVTYALDQPVEIASGQSSVGRYSLVDKKRAVEERDDSSVFITVEGAQATVQATGGDIVRVAVYGLDGRMDRVENLLSASEVRVELSRECQIVSVMLVDGTVHNFKVVAYNL